MANDALMDQHTQTIIKRYTRMYDIFFRYSIFIIPLVLSLVAALLLQSRLSIPKNIGAVRTQENVSFSEINGIYKAERISDQVGTILKGDGNIDILAGELQIADNVIVGRNNLIKLKGIILPSNTYIIDTNLSGDIKQFDSTYSIESLKRVIENRILTAVPEGEGVTTTNINSMFLASSNPLESQRTNMELILETLQKRLYFAQSQGAGINENTNLSDSIKNKDKLIAAQKLGCLTMPKIFGGFCDKNLSSFLQKVPGLNLERNWKDILAIASQLHQDDHVSLFCENIMANVLKNPFPSAELDTIMNNTCLSYNKRYLFMKDFLNVQHELEGIASPNLVGQSTDLNLFKLVSLWQKIASQSRKKTLDTSLLITYLQFSETILQQPSMEIPQFYIDALYYFHNVYLKNILQTIAISSVNPATKNDVSILNEKIALLNKGNENIGLIGLEKRIKVATISQEIKSAAKLSVASIRDFEKAFTDSMSGYPQISIQGIQTDNASQSTSIVGSIANTDGPRISAAMSFRYQDRNFVPVSIRIPQYPTTDKILATYMQKNPGAPLGILLEIIKNNLDVTAVQSATACATLQQQTNIEITSCDATNAQITMYDTTMALTFDNNTITRATSSNAKVQSFMDKNLADGAIPLHLIGATIQTAVSITTAKEVPDTSTSIDPNILAIIRKTKEYLHLTPTDIKPKAGKYLVTFTLQGYEMATLIDIEKNYKMSPLAIQVGGNAITIRDFSLTLIPFSQSSINLFTKDPLNYIRIIDEKSYNEINALINPSSSN